MPVELNEKGKPQSTKLFYFNASEIEHKQSNEKREFVFAFSEVKPEQAEKVIHLKVTYSQRGTRTKTDEILKKSRKAGVSLTEDELQKAIGVFCRQTEVDFFINKDAHGFLREQFNMWLYQYMFHEETIFEQERLGQLQAIRDTAYDIIDFIAQFEDELIKVWDKPKFVRNSNYVITLDKITDDKLVEKIKAHNNYSLQVQEWNDLGINEDNSKVPIDTKYFKDLELEILGQFEDLDGSLDGWLIKSENYQALNTILPKFKEKVQCIYIDPPFNLDSSNQFLYRTNYKDANWATLLENRLQIAKEWLNERGSIFVRCDYNGNWIVRCLLDSVFGENNFRNELTISRISKQDPKVRKFNTATDSLYFFSVSENFTFNLLFKKLIKAKKERWHAMDSQGQGQALYIFGYLFSPPIGRHWTYGQENIQRMEQEEKIRLRCKKCKYIHISGIWKNCPQCKNETEVRVEYLLSGTKEKQIDSNWTDISGYSSIWNFRTENSEKLLNRVIQTASDNNDLVMDYFLGSGTTTAVAHKLGRK